jgi:hypothetical protein
LGFLAFYLYYIFLLIVQIIKGRISIDKVMLSENFNTIIAGVSESINAFHTLQGQSTAGIKGARSLRKRRS